jgi:hypothetical protein
MKKADTQRGLKGEIMVAKKTTKKAVAKKAPAKKVTKKAVAKKAASSKAVVTKERFYSMVSEAAYFAAENDGNKKGAADYWMEAESAVSKKFSVK